MLPNDEHDHLLMVLRTMHLDARGSTVAQVAVGGEVAVDSAGNIAVASVVSGALNVASFTPALAARWQVSYPVGGADETAISAGY